MIKQREALQVALDALIEVTGWQWAGPMRVIDEVEDAIAGIREVLAEPEQEPVACLINPPPIGFWNGKETAYFEHELVDGLLPTGDCTIPLYIDPPARKPLTEPELNAIEPTWPNEWNYDDVLAFVRAIERAHGITE